MADLLIQLQQLIRELPKDVPGSSIELLLQQMETTSARLLRLCAIPHQFTPDIIQILLPGLDAAQANQHYLGLSQLPIILLRENERAIHDEARIYLFRQWLEKEREGEFVAASARLAGYFRDRLDSVRGEQRENAQRQHMFHALAVDQDSSFREFERIWSEQYDQFHLNGCQTLIKLVREYDPILTRDRRVWVSYFEAMLAADLFQLPEAESKFKAILNDPIALQDADLRIRTLVRLGHVSRKNNDWQAAIGFLEDALGRARQAQGIGKTHHILHELGVAYREIGELDKADGFFRESLRAAEEVGDISAMATSYNGLGTLKLRIGDMPSAINFYQEALSRLRDAGDRFRFAQVYNNLGMAHGRLGELAKSREYYEKSLRIKEEAGDTSGQAMTLNNLIPIYQIQGEVDKAVSVARRASELFLQVRDTYNAALAKSNLGKLFRKIGEEELSNQAFSEAVALFEKCNKSAQAEEVRKEVSSATTKLPWWLWIPLILGLLAVSGVIVALIVVALL